VWSSTAVGQNVTERVLDEDGRPQVVKQQWSHVGLLRARDLSAFGLLRLDMLPAHTADAEVGAWTFGAQYSYQNTFILSDNVRGHLQARNVGERTPLTSQDAAAILALPDDAYFVDAEIGLADLIVQHRVSRYWSFYITIPYINYGEGALDGVVEHVHDAIGVSQQGRDLVARDRFAIVYRIGEARFAELDPAVRGFGDPVAGVRYSFPEPRFGWDVVAELAVKVPTDGRRFLLSTGKQDVGGQLTLQRRLGPTGRQAMYLAGSLVRYAGAGDAPENESQTIPTLIAGYSFGLTPRTSVILQGYASRSVVQHSTADELTDNKYQLSLGVQSRGENMLWSCAFTENIVNFNNTPDIALQVGVAYMPKAK
jgi:hypothetical protein